MSGSRTRGVTKVTGTTKIGVVTGLEIAKTFARSARGLWSSNALSAGWADLATSVTFSQGDLKAVSFDPQHVQPTLPLIGQATAEGAEDGDGQAHRETAPASCETIRISAIKICFVCFTNVYLYSTCQNR
jgi:hypothetical protein